MGYEFKRQTFFLGVFQGRKMRTWSLSQRSKGINFKVLMLPLPSQNPTNISELVKKGNIGNVCRTLQTSRSVGGKDKQKEWRRMHVFYGLKKNMLNTIRKLK